MIQVDTLNTLCNSYLSSKKSNKYFCLTVVANIFLIILASQILWTHSRLADLAIYYFLLSSKDLSIRCLESYLTGYPCFLYLQGFVCLEHSTTLCTLFLIYYLLYLLQIVCKVLISSANVKLQFYLSTQTLILCCNLSTQLLHFLLNFRPCVLRQV